MFRLSLLALALSSSAAFAAGHCAGGKTMTDGVLTIATGNPAYFPWVLNDDPKSGEGFEAAVAYEVAKRMGFEGDAVQWTSASFDQSIQPGAKNFDFNLQQFSITEDREKAGLAPKIDVTQAQTNLATTEALRKSQIDLMDDAATSHPFYWSAFAVVGDGALAVTP